MISFKAPSDLLSAVRDSMPKGLLLPEEIVAALDWLEARGHVLETRSGPYGLALSPDERTRGARSLAGAVFRPAPEQFSRYWLDSTDAAVTDRLASIVDTGGDGSSAGIWIDDDGRHRFVHLGSGSGSLWMSVMTDDPVDFLRLLAIGYDELCWPEIHHLTPEQAYASEMGQGEGSADGWVAPTAFRNWVETTFKVAIPATAREILPEPADDQGNPKGDAFAQWLDQRRSEGP